MTRYFHVIEAGLGTAPPADPSTTVGPPGAVTAGGWTTLSGVTGNVVKDVDHTRTSKNLSAGEAEAGIAAFTLDGDNGWLDPTNPGSPYAGFLVTGCPIRCRLTDGLGTFQNEWRGFVKHWPMSESVKGGQLALIDCYDALGWLGSVAAPYPTELHRAIMSSGPSSYWPHDEPAGSPVIRDVVGGFDATLLGAAAAAGPSLTAEGYGGSGAFSNLSGDIAQASGSAFPSVAPWTVTILVRVFATTGTNLMYLMTNPGGGTVPSGVAIGPTYADVSAGGTAGLGHWNYGGTTIVPGLYQLTLGYNGSDLYAWANGALTQHTVPGVAQSVPATLQWGASLNVTSTSTALGVQIAHVGIWNRVLTDAEVSAMWQAASRARGADWTDIRIGYLLDQVDWPAAKRSLGAAKMTLGPVRMAVPGVTVTLLDLLRDAVQYEDGTLAAGSAADIIFYGRYGNPAPSFAVGGIGAPKQAATYSTVDTTAVTTASVSEPPVIYTAGTNLVNGRTVTMRQLANSADDAWLTAQRAVQLGSTPRPGIDSVTLDPVDTPAALNMALNSVGTVARRPRWSGIDLVEPHLVTSIRGTGGEGRHPKRTFSLLKPPPTQWRLNCTNANPTGATTPTLARYNPGAAGVQLEAWFRAANWAQAGSQILVAHNDVGAGGTMYRLYYNVTAGVATVQFDWQDNAGVTHNAKSVPITRTGTRYIWAIAIFQPATGTTVFYVSFGNRYTYLSWGAVVFGVTTLRSAAGPIEVGVEKGTNPFSGDILTAAVAVPNGAILASLDATRDNQPGASSWTSSTGETWSLQGTGTLNAT